MLIAWVGLGIVGRRNAWLSIQLEKAIFWVFALTMVAFAALRPIGIARDDLAYLNIYNTVCPTLSCGQWVQGARDWGWYSFVGLLKSIWNDPRVILCISAVAAIIKLGIIFKLSHRPMLALLFFTGVFYQVQDLTAFRVALSLAVYMVAIYLLVKRHRLMGTLALFFTGVFHKQAMVSPFILLSGILRCRYVVFVLLAMLPICLLFAGISYQGYREILPYMNLPWIQPIIQQGIDSYIAIGQSGGYDEIRILPYSYLPLIVFIVVFSKNVYLADRDLYRYCAMSFVITCWLTWLFAGWQEPQARFFEYFALPTVLLVGNFRKSLLTNLGAIAVSAVFVVRYNVLHHLLI